jgi:hypothetical protein
MTQIDYDQLARTMREQPENDIDAELAKPEWEEFRQLVPERGTASTEEREKKLQSVRHFVDAKLRSDQKARERQEKAAAAPVDLQADNAALASYKDAWNRFVMEHRSNGTPPTRPALRALSETYLDNIDGGANRPESKVPDVYRQQF